MSGKKNVPIAMTVNNYNFLKQNCMFIALRPVLMQVSRASLPTQPHQLFSMG